jgi:predicted TIM-barrel fold metal-dependent hydrolase
LDPSAHRPIDCDIHPVIPTTRTLLPYLDPYWREHITRRGMEVDNLELSSFPTNAPLNCRSDWRPDRGPPGADLGLLSTHVLDPFQIRYGILNVLNGAQIMHSEDLSAALCRAINRWIAAEWLDRDPRLRASITVPVCSPELAAEEVERCADDKRFVQVLLLSQAEMPLGRRQYWPLYRAAEKHGLPIGIHAGSAQLHAPSATGWFSYYLEDYVQQAQGFAGTLNSLLTEGVFVKFPALRVVLIESGVTWLPAAMWRINKTWRGVRAETPWQERMPSEVIRDNVRLTMQPFDAPDTVAALKTILEAVGSDQMLLFATDYPHWHFDGTDAMPDGLPPDLIRKILLDNPLETYPRLA